jgi:hypothetical protein
VSITRESRSYEHTRSATAAAQPALVTSSQPEADR